MKNISILGSTGSIGTQTLDVAEKLGIGISALAANKSVDKMEAQARRFHPKLIAMADEPTARDLKVKLKDTDTCVRGGMEALCEAALQGDVTVAAIVGVAGLEPTMAAVEAGRTIALANKETLVCAGSLVMARARERGARILPVDSEHSAIFQCLACGERGEADKILLTASGGPFFGQTRGKMYNYTPADALCHPTWSMGAKITVDSATMMNKGFELIEAMWLYNMSPNRIQVVIHPESVVHSMVEFRDGAVIAQMGVPDMRLPIQYALTYPERLPSPVKRLDLFDVASLHFKKPDYTAFPCLKMATDAAGKGGNVCAVLNGANEAAVAAFLQGRIPFGRISETVETALDRVEYGELHSIEDVLNADAQARSAAGI